MLQTIMREWYLTESYTDMKEEMVLEKLDLL